MECRLSELPQILNKVYQERLPRKKEKSKTKVRLEIMNVRAVRGNPTTIVVELRSEWERKCTDLDIETNTDPEYPSDRYYVGSLNEIRHEVAEDEDTRQRNIK